MTEIVERYRKAIGETATLVRAGLRMSAAAQGRLGQDRALSIAAVIFPKLLLHARAILKLAPRLDSQGTESIEESWDVSSMAALARALVESYYMMFYVAVDRVEDDIRQFRWLLWDYHSATRGLAMQRLADPASPTAANAKTAVEALHATIVNHAVFIRQTPNVRKSVREGQLSVFATNTDLSTRAGIDPKYYRAAFMFLSGYAHAHAFSIEQLSGFRDGTDEGLRLITAIVEYCAAYVSLALRDFAGLMPGQDGVGEDAAAIVESWVAMVADSRRTPFPITGEGTG